PDGRPRVAPSGQGVRLRDRVALFHRPRPRRNEQEQELRDRGRGAARPMKNHLWRGEWLDDAGLEKRLETLPAFASERDGLDTRVLLNAAAAYAARLKAKGGNHAALKESLAAAGTSEEIEALIAEAAAFLERENLEAKLRRELGSTSPFLPVRIGFQDAVFEAWAPLG